jgi:Ca2+:H+ antiporter
VPHRLQGADRAGAPHIGTGLVGDCTSIPTESNVMIVEAKHPPSRIRQLTIPLSLLTLVPVAPILHYLLHLPAPAVFLAGAIAIAVLADWMRRATEQLAEHVGTAIGGLLNVSFGSLAELILALFVLSSGQTEVVRAQLTGSIIGTSLLGLGLAVVIGGAGRVRQTFKRERAGQLTSLLVIVLIALLLPAVFHLTNRSIAHDPRVALGDEELSIGVALVLIGIYAANLVYTLVTHRDIFSAAEPRRDGAESDTAWPLSVAIIVMVGLTAVIAFEAELVSAALEATAKNAGLSSAFLGVIVLALVGTASDLFAATVFARQNKMGLVMSICVGSSIQVALVVAPVLVLASWFMGRPMTLVFTNPLDLFAIAGTAFIVNAIAGDGETTWFEGVLLIGVYALFALAFFFSAPIG